MIDLKLFQDLTAYLPIALLATVRLYGCQARAGKREAMVKQDASVLT